ncbi:MAG: TauD/TfdA family dioxygenase [Proteobacteria bacterium]|nr:TauD/TfdA family dioxygenase [Pseudomonadota bacterium]MDA1022385.1 TauD/TfdA family dioxygenase [Pseudomonadota bacterium]
MDISPLHPLFVGEVTGLNIGGEIDAERLAELTSALDTYGALVFRDQSIDDEAQMRFSALFGPLETTRRAHRPGHKLRLDIHVSDISNLDEASKLLAPADYRLMSSLANRLWHTDSTFKRIPARYSILSAHTLPSRGGETELADMRAAYDDLDDETKTRINDYVCEHSIFNSRATVGFTDFTDEERATLPPVPQVLVRTHPGSGRKSLYLASHAEKILGLPLPEGKMQLLDLMEHATRRQYVYTHHWQPGDVLMWDNRCTMHRGRWHDPAEVRDMRRTTVSDEVPTLTSDEC